MTRKRVRMTCVAVVCLGALTTAIEARAQSGSSAASSAAAAANYNNMTMGMGFLPLPGMFGSPTPSATDAAALGMTAPQGGMMGMGGGNNGNLFMNPMASPLLYGSMFPMTQQQTGLAMLAAQTQMMGIGSGRISGVRPGAAGGPGTRGRQAQSGAGARGTTRQPGGLAARYFNRTSHRPRIPQGFYNRPNQHYPQVVR
jgi:hypothetical protein